MNVLVEVSGKHAADEGKQSFAQFSTDCPQWLVDVGKANKIRG